MKDLSIEQSLKTYEEVWLSKIFQFLVHIRSKSADLAGDVTVHVSKTVVMVEPHHEKDGLIHVILSLINDIQ